MPTDSPPPDVLDPDMLDPRWLQVGSFNMEWLSARYEDGYVPRTPRDYFMLGSLITSLDIDVLSFQEVDGLEAMEMLYLPERWKSLYSETGYSQKMGLLYRSDRVSVGNHREIELPTNTTPGYKDPVAVEVTSLQSGRRYTVIIVHMKANAQDSSVDKRATQFSQLHSWLLTAQTSTGTPVINELLLMGDFNDTLDGIGYRKTLTPLVEDERLYFLSEQCAGGTIQGFESRIDHIVMSQQVAETLRSDGQQCFITYHDDLSPWSDYEGGYGGEQNISDHRPIWTYIWDTPEVGE